MNARCAPTAIQRVVGVDLSLTSTGVGICVKTLRGYTMASSSVTSTLTKTGRHHETGAARESLLDRVNRQRQITDEVCHYTTCADLVIIEGMIGGVQMGKFTDRAGLLMRVIDRTVRAGVPVGILAPTSIKKAITDNGKADKAAVAGAIVNMYPDTIIRNADEADAMGAAHLGAVVLGWDVPTLKRHRDVKWTDHPGDLGFAADPIDLDQLTG